MSSACSSRANSPSATNQATLSPNSAPAPRFVQVSNQLRNAIGQIYSGRKTEAQEALSKIAKSSFASPTDKQLASFTLARLKNAKTTQEMISLYNPAFGHPLLGNYARLKAAKLIKDSDDEASIQSLLQPAANSIARIISQKQNAKTASLDQNIADEINAELLYRLAESYFRQQKKREAVTTFAQIRQGFPKTIYATGSAYYLGKIALENEQSGKTAMGYFRIYLTQSPGGRFAPEVVKMIRSATNNSDSKNPVVIQTTQKDHNLMAYACYKHTLWKMALEEWSKSNYRHILRTICLAKLNQKQKAVNEFIAVAKADPNNPLIINAAETLAKSLSKQMTLTLYTRLLPLKLKNKDEILYNIARRSNAKAYGYYKKVVFEYPKSKNADDSLWWLIWHHIKASYKTKGKAKSNHLTQAAKYCVVGVQNHSKSELAPMYAFWSGKLHERMGRRAEAISIYNTTFKKFPGNYYSFRSIQRAQHVASLIRKKKNKKAKLVPDRKWKTHPARKSPQTNWSWPGPPRYFQYRQLVEKTGHLPSLLAWLGLYDEAIEFTSFKTPRYIRGWLYVKAGKELKGLSISSYKLRGNPTKEPFWQFNYPLAYSKFVDREARKHGVDPLLAHGLIRQESKYDPDATSRSNAMGLMQLLKGTAYGVAKHNGIKLANSKQIYRPETNIKLGCAYLGYVQRGKGGNSMLAVASYNGGPNAVKRWVRQHKASGISDMDYFVENIPYRETRGYVRKVFENYWIYETIYLKKY